jgi:hypothetical protein
MVSKESIEQQLKKINFNPHGWGRGEVNELPNIILPDEEIFEVANGIYDGGFALLVATNVRVLLIDQKPMNYLTVEDLRFDMISEMDYSHRLLGARISISAGDKNLKFLSYNQPRLRKLIGHVQHCMAEAKKKQTDHGEGQLQHLEKLNEQLRNYMLAQQEQQNRMQEQLIQAANGQGQQIKMPEPVKLEPELSDYLFAQSLLAQHRTQAGQSSEEIVAEAVAPIEEQQAKAPSTPPPKQDADDLYEAGVQEVFGKKPSLPQLPKPSEIHPIQIAYSKLPMALRDRKFGRPQQTVPRH